MKKPDLQNLIRHYQRIIDLLMMERLLEPADDKPEPTPDKYWGEELPTDTHRTVTLRIPKGMEIAEAFSLAYLYSGDTFEEFIEREDADLQKALDEVEK